MRQRLILQGKRQRPKSLLLCPSMNPYKTVAFYTLGCKLNFSETSTIARLFEQGGYAKVDVLGANEKFNILEFLDKAPSDGKAHIENGHIKEVKSFVPSYSAN